MKFSMNAVKVCIGLAIAAGMFATPAQGATLFSETYSASGGTATDNTYTLFAGSPATVTGGQQDFSGGPSANYQSPDGAAGDFSVASPVTISFDYEFTGPLSSPGNCFIGLLDPADPTTNFAVLVNADSGGSFLGVVVLNSGDSEADSVLAGGLTAGTTYAVSATFTPGVAPNTTDVIYSMVATAGPGGDITTGTPTTLALGMPSVLGSSASGAISGEGNFLVDNILVTGTAAGSVAMPATTPWGQALTALILMVGGSLAMGRMRKQHTI